MQSPACALVGTKHVVGAVSIRGKGGDAMHDHAVAHWMAVRYVQFFCCPSCEWITPHQIHSTPPWKNNSHGKTSRSTSQAASAHRGRAQHRQHTAPAARQGGGRGEGEGRGHKGGLPALLCLRQLPRAGWPAAGVLLFAWRVAATRSSCSPQPGCCRDWAAGCWLGRCLLARSASLLFGRSNQSSSSSSSQNVFPLLGS